jgi:hypothetical protein
MARRPNYAHERSERNRAKQAKRDAKLRQRQEASAERKASTTDADAPPDAPAQPDEEPR